VDYKPRRPNYTTDDDSDNDEMHKRSHAWKKEQHVDFTVTLTILAGSPDPNLHESTGEEENQSDADSLMDEKNTPCPNWSSGDGFLQIWYELQILS
jgi:hypothetical protein